MRSCVEIKIRAPPAVGGGASIAASAMAWRFHAIDATLSPWLRRLDGVEVHEGPCNVSRYLNSLVDFHTGAVEGDVALIACDGLCDVSSSQEATDVVRKGLVENADDPVRAGREPLFNSSRRPRVARRLTAVVPALRPAEPEGIS